MMLYKIDNRQRGRGIVSQMSVTERELRVESSYVCTGPTSPGALHEECNEIPALTDRERAFGDAPND